MSSPAESPISSPKILGHYELQSLLGSGGSGDVYRARDLRLNRDVAVKVLHENLKDGQTRDRIRHEAMVLSQLNHPGIATVFDFGTHDGTDYVVTELIQGRTLTQLINQERLPEHEILRLALEITEAVAEAHKHGIVHRDIKPANIRLTESGRVKVLDFGLAAHICKPEDVTRTDTSTESSGGTLHYMAPEQLLGMAGDPRSDVYSIGVVLYEAVTGRPPFDATAIAALIDAVLHERPLAPTFWRPDISSRFEGVILRCLEKNPDYRYVSCQDLAADLRRTANATVDNERSVVVLYFENMSGENDAYLRDGMTEDISTELSRVAGLRSFSRSSALPFRDKPVTPAFVGQKVGAAYVLEGSLRRDGDRLRISASLVETRTGLTVWAERYDREFCDVFAIQSDIAVKIATALKLVFTAERVPAVATTSEHEALIGRIAMPNVRAYDYFLRGRHYFHQFRRRGYVLAREMFDKAITIDPNYARAYAGIADCCSFEYMYWDSNPELLERAEQASRRALELAPQLAEAHASRGLSASLSKMFDEAQDEFERAIRLDPKLFEAYYFCARCLYSQGKLKDASRWFEQAARVRPDEYQALMLWASTLNGLGQKADALTIYRRGVDAASHHLEQYPEDVRALYFGANGLTQIGETDRARRWVERALDLEPDEPLVTYNIGCVYALLGDVDAAISCLERSITKGWAQKQWLKNDPDLESLRADPRFQKLIS